MPEASAGGETSTGRTDSPEPVFASDVRLRVLRLDVRDRLAVGCP